MEVGAAEASTVVEGVHTQTQTHLVAGCVVKLPPSSPLA